MVRVEDLVPGFVERRVPERPEWVAENQRDPRTAAEVYGTFALAFSTLYFALFAVGIWTPIILLFVPLVVVNAVAWTWVLWHLRISKDGVVPRRRALTTGLAIGAGSWLTVGPLLIAGTTVPKLLKDGGVDVSGQLLEPLAFGLYVSVAGIVTTAGIPTIASVALALWTLNCEERSGREKRRSNYDFE
ncbi:hypothetical protein [Halorubellus salinus]|uniref:hypothetical protein n=1 Tax=Halorubellus salinus TaxID=755309 RepID=UPI001D0844A2|nr:hypothetical protein [Halorubellus salinus]